MHRLISRVCAGMVAIGAASNAMADALTLRVAGTPRPVLLQADVKVIPQPDGTTVYGLRASGFMRSETATCPNAQATLSIDLRSPGQNIQRTANGQDQWALTSTRLGGVMQATRTTSEDGVETHIVRTAEGTLVVQFDVTRELKAALGDATELVVAELAAVAVETTAIDGNRSPTFPTFLQACVATCGARGPSRWVYVLSAKGDLEMDCQCNPPGCVPN